MIKPKKNKFNRRNIFHAFLLTSALLLTLSTLQILFDVPILPIFIPTEEAQGAELTAILEDGIQKAVGSVGNSYYPDLIVQRGIPVELTLSATENVINQCNENLIFPQYGLNIKLKPGANVVNFTPEESGVFPYQCWMGMIKSSITVVENLGFDISRDVNEDTEKNSDEVLYDSSLLKNNSEFKRPVFEKKDTDEISINGWLEKQLIPSNDEGSREIRVWTGWIFDRCCVGISPVRHSKSCNLMGSCFDSGLGIFEYVPEKAFDTYTAVESFLNFDGASKELAVEFLRALPAEWKNNVTVKVTGYAINNIPAATDEELVPETDLSRVDHYLSGIHITSIEAAYINGLSTFNLPEPNIVFNQP